MEHNREGIINEIQSLVKALKSKGGWITRENSEHWFNHEILEDALSLIKEQHQKIFELENRLKECENGYDGTLFLDRCKLYDAENKVKELTEENERLQKLCDLREQDHKDTCELLFKAEELLAQGMCIVKADTVREMLQRVKELAYYDCTETGVAIMVIDTDDIDQIANELLGENQNV